jgi:hypothetical protein
VQSSSAVGGIVDVGDGQRAGAILNVPRLAVLAGICGALMAGCTSASGAPLGARASGAPTTSSSADLRSAPAVPTPPTSPDPKVTASSHSPSATRTPTAGASAGGYDPTACSLLTPADVNAILGTHATRGEPTYPTPQPRGLSACLISNQATQPYQPVRGLRIDVWREDDSHQVYTGLIPSGGAPITGLGDEAKGYAVNRGGAGTGGIAIRKGRDVIAIFVATPELPFVTLDQLRDLVAKALSRV